MSELSLWVVAPLTTTVPLPCASLVSWTSAPLVDRTCDMVLPLAPITLPTEAFGMSMLTLPVATEKKDEPMLAVLRAAEVRGDIAEI